MKTFLKHITIRILLVLGLLLGMNWVYTQFFFEQDLQKYSPVLELVQDFPKDAKVLYIGESSNTTSRDDDQDKRAISDFVDDYFPSLKISDITKPAGHSGIYYDLLKLVC